MQYSCVPVDLQAVEGPAGCASSRAGNCIGSIRTIIGAPTGSHRQAQPVMGKIIKKNFSNSSVLDGPLGSDPLFSALLNFLTCGLLSITKLSKTHILESRTEGWVEE